MGVHQRCAPRIFGKQARSAAAGYSVTLLVADARGNELCDGVAVVDLGIAPLGRLGRMLIVCWRAWRWLRHAKPALVQVHDSKLLPLALALRWFQRLRVIYDVHEDNVLFVWHKGYLPRWLKPLLAAARSLGELGRRSRPAASPQRQRQRRAWRSCPTTISKTRRSSPSFLSTRRWVCQ